MFRAFEFPDYLPLRPKLPGKAETYDEAHALIAEHARKALGEGFTLVEMPDADEPGWDFLAHNQRASIQLSIETDA